MMRGPCVLANLAAREEMKKTIMEIGREAAPACKAV